MKNKKIFSINSLRTIKQIIVSHTIFLALFAGVAYALAQETTEAMPLPNTPQNPPAEVATTTDEVVTPRGEKKAVFEENLAERKSALKERTRERVKNLSANMSYRLEAVTTRMQNIIVRLESRIDKLKTEGADTTEAEATLAKAQDLVGLAISDIANIDQDIESLVGSATAKKDWAGVKGKFVSSHQHVKEAHEALRKTLALLNNPTANETSEVAEEAKDTDTTE